MLYYFCIPGRVAWSSTYTYILLLFVAAAFVAFVARPRDRGEAVKRLFAGTLLGFDELSGEGVRLSGPRLLVRCLEGGRVQFDRICVDGLTCSGAVSLAVTFKGKDVEILERDTPGYQSDEAMAGARFEIDMTGHEWRHIRWVDEDSGLWCAFTLHVRPGITMDLELKR